MIVKSIKTDDFEIIIQQDDYTNLCSVSLLKNNKEAAFQGNLDLESAMEVFDYFLDLEKGNDMSGWQGAIE